MIVVELTGVDPDGVERTFYFSDESYVTRPDDTPPHTVFEPALEQAADISIYVFSDGMTGGASASEIGETVITNTGDFDYLAGYAFDGRPMVVRVGEKGAPYPGAFTTVIRGTVAGVEANFSRLIVLLQDRQAILDRPAQANRYLGDNALPNGLEGTADDIKGEPKPLLLGKGQNITPPCVNTSKLVYQVNDGAVFKIEAVYVGGVAWTFDANYSTSADLMSAALTPASATYATCLREGLFRLSDDPADLEVTADVIEGLQITGGGRDAAGIIEALYNRALQAGFAHPQEETDH